MADMAPRTGGRREPGPGGRRPLWRRRWFVITAGLFLLLLIVAALSGDTDQPEDRAARGDDPTATATPTPAATPDPIAEARDAAAPLVAGGNYAAAIRLLEGAGLDGDADRVRRRGTKALLAAARRALDRTRYEAARATALDARRLGPSSGVRSVLAAANAGIARERAAARERRRQARIARDLRTCTAAEKDTVRVGGGTPAGCTAFAAELEAERAEQAAQEAQEAEQSASCAPGYSPCIPPYPPDLDCADTGPVTVAGSDPHGLDADGDGVACGGD
jgi:hypothetical protein